MPDSCHYAVTASLHLPGGGRLPIPVWLTYSPQDCLAVRMTFGLGSGGSHDATWIFGWELLARGLDVPAGLGDVRVAPAVGSASWLQLRLGAEGAQACVDLDAEGVRRFLAVVRPRAARDARLVADALDAELSRIVERA